MVDLAKGPGALDAVLESLVERVALRTAELVLERLGHHVDASPTPTSLVTKQVLAAGLGTSTATVDRLVRDGRIPFVRLGDVRRFDPVAVRAALEAAPAPPTTPAPAVRLLSRRPR